MFGARTGRRVRGIRSTSTSFGKATATCSQPPFLTPASSTTKVPFPTPLRLYAAVQSSSSASPCTSLRSRAPKPEREEKRASDLFHAILRKFRNDGADTRLGNRLKMIQIHRAVARQPV